jgi:aryl-alcohol dehydrogenase-like predicted oxidoreductase
MRTVTLGTSGAQVSALCLGAMYFGTRNDEATSFALLDQYVAAGGTFIDTANIYAHWVEGFQGGESEALLGRWLKARGNRNSIFLASKVGFNYPAAPRSLAARHIIQEAEKSLTRLGVDTLDLFYAHVDDYRTPLEETLEAFDRLVQTGKVRYIGASNYLAWRLEKARWISRTNGWAEYCCVQQRYSYLRGRRGVSFEPQVEANDDLVSYTRMEGVTLLAYSVLLGGAYTRSDRAFGDQYLGPDSDARLAALRAVADETGATANQVVLAWMLQQGVLPLIAASTREQLQENLDALDVTLSDEQLTRLNAAGG